MTSYTWSFLKLQTSSPPSHQENKDPPPHTVQGTPEYECGPKPRPAIWCRLALVGVIHLRGSS
ncbi:hypothetical protein DSO57_1038352 [Entomophthora muscae]|uniref:Uncharacterized protein n=1 Tax=Entomophthora muscae TaxID=34485 RepID=A0ACC2SBQ7_9FUNG|nr:hypothetical protein DSO57_1038352 [Entomophthora muscae]